MELKRSENFEIGDGKFVYHIPLTPDEMFNSDSLKSYQEFVDGLKFYPKEHSIVYPALGLAGEAGEYCEKIKKFLRGDGELDKELAIKELGDCLFYIAASASDLGFTIKDVADINIKKLSDRQKRNVLNGNGDTR